MRSLLIALLVATATAAPTRADEASDRHDAAIALLNQMHTIDNVSAMVPNILSQVRQGVTRGDPDLIKQFDTFGPRLQGEAEAEKVALVEQLADVYAKVFTAEEIKQMGDFYQTPLGQKISATQGQVSGEIFKVTREWGTKIAQKMAAEASADLQNAKP